MRYHGMTGISAAAAEGISLLPYGLAMNRFASLDNARAAGLADHVGWLPSLDRLVRASVTGVMVLHRSPVINVRSVGYSPAVLTPSSTTTMNDVPQTELVNAPEP